VLKSIAAFEVKYQLRAPLFAIGFALFFLLTFGSVTVDEIQIGGKGNVHLNSPFAICQTVGVMGVFAMFVAAAFVANVVVRDDETGFAPILRATRVTKRDYLVGRFTGAFFVAFLVLTSVPIGMLVGSWMPWLDSEKVGPLVPAHYVYALFVIGLPSMLVMSAGFFALATVTRSMMWTYVGLVGFLVLFITSRVLLRDPSLDRIAALTDPFGISAMLQTTRYWTAAERNTTLPPLAGIMLVNRAIWIGAAFALFGVAFLRFRFDAPGARASKKKKTTPAPTPSDDAPPAARLAPHAASAKPSALTELAAVTRFDMRFVFRSPAFFVLLAIGMFNAFGGMTGVVTQRGVDYLPVTRAMSEVLKGSFTIVPIIVAVYYAGELVWRDHDRRMHEIVGATSAPDWAFVLPKVLAITLVLGATYLASVLVSVIFQLWHGYTHLELGHYLVWFVLPDLLVSIELAVLAVFVQVLVPHKFTGWAVMLVYVVASIALPTAGYEHNLYNYGSASPVPLTDMNGRGRFWIGEAWFELYWLAFASVLVVLAHALWRRGAETSLVARLRRLPARLRGIPGAIAAAGLLTFVGSGAFIYYNTNVLNRYRTGPENDRRAAEYEKALIGFEHVPEPRITDVVLAVDLYPREARAVTRGSYVIENRTGAPLDAVHLRWDFDDRLSMDTLEVDGAKPEKDFGDLHYRIYRFDPPMKPGERRGVRFVTTLAERGFPNARPLTRIVENGSFLNNFEISPFLGIDRSGFLTDRAKRRKYGLPELRPPKLEDEAARANHYLRHDSDFVNAELTLTTDADEVPVAPGQEVFDVVVAGRRTLKTKTEAPILQFFSMQSARYAEAQSSWSGRGKGGGPVALAVYHHPEHDHNTLRMLEAMKLALGTFTEAFSPYQFKQARILEFPSYESFAQAFAGTVPYSEAIGFVQNHPDETVDGDEKIDLVTYVTAHELGHQWWAHQVIGADKQGMTMLSETFAQYSAMLAMEKLYGPAMVRKFLKFELDGYLRSRGGEVVEELPLVRVENQPYIHYRKGTLVMYWLKEAVGEDVVNRALRRLIAKYAFKPAPYPSASEFVALLREEAGPAHDQLITDLFEKITLYDMKAKDASSRRLPDGRYEVTFTVDGKKLYADGQGKETEALLSEPFELGAFTKQPGKKGFSKESVLAFERRVVVSGAQTVKLVVAEAPAWVGVDPYNKRIDRNSDDNLTEVTPAP
jgi:aminopeptidase N